MANFIFLIITAMLAGYHAFLICTAQTSWEHGSGALLSYVLLF